MLSAVVNSTPLISLHDIGRLDILSKMYSKVHSPKSSKLNAPLNNGLLYVFAR